MINVLAILLILSGVATVYDEARWYGQPLYCDTASTNYTYSYEMAEAMPWVALDVGLYESGQVACGDLLTIYLDNGIEFQAYALDAGPLAQHQTALGGPIVVDVPGVVLAMYGLDDFGLSRAVVVRGKLPLTR